MIDWSKNRKFMAWTFAGNSRMYEALNNYGHKMDTVGIFTFEVYIDGTIRETRTDVNSLLPYVERWKHINWLLTVMNHGNASIFTALRNNTNGAQDKFISEIHRILDKYPWASGIDIDLEKGGNEENSIKALALFKRIYDEVKSRTKSRHVHADLPAMAGPGLSAGGENWCNYADLDKYLDTAAIMSYGMAWAGSAPGPISPAWWIKDVYNYAITAMSPDKIFMGLPAYGFQWQLSHKPEELGDYYRGVGFSYYYAQLYMQGNYTHQDDYLPLEQRTQKKIPFAGFWDWDNMSGTALLHVYDYLEGWDTLSTPTYPRRQESYGGRQFLTSYSRAQENKSTGLIAEINGKPRTSSGAVTIKDSNASLRKPHTGETGGELTYRINIPVAGTYDLMVKLNFPWWDKNRVVFKFGGTTSTIHETRLHYPYWRTVHYVKVKSNHYFTAGNHDIVINDASYGLQIYGFQVAQKSVLEATTGGASYSLKPRKFKDVNGDWVSPYENKYKITTEALRRDPESALIWYEDWRDYGVNYGGELPDWFSRNSGEWDVFWEKGGGARPYSELRGSGDLSLDYNQFKDIHLKATISVDNGFNGKAGIYIGDILLTLNYPAQTLELYQGTTLKKSTPFSFTRNSFNTISMRVRGSNVRVYTGANETLRFQTSATSAPGKVGFRANGGTIKCNLLRVGDAWWYMPQERYRLTLPDGTVEEYGKLERTNTLWDDNFGLFKLTADVEEIDTRRERISMDYDYEHSKEIILQAGHDYEIKIDGADVGVWTSRIYLGDSDGFSLMYYSDVDTITHFANRAAYDWKLNGIALWSLGQEDLRVWEYLPDMVPNPYE